MRYRTSIQILLLTASIAAVATAAAAQGAAPAPDEAGSNAANPVTEVVVTANRAPTPADRVGQSVTVITASQIQSSQAVSVADIISRTPGVSFDRNGGPGATTSVFIRGAEPNQTMVLIDGVKVNDPTDAETAYDFSNLMTDDVSRIEVLRGPQSTLYGSAAIGGVVNVITAAPTKPLEGVVQAEAGDYSTALVNAALGGKDDRFDWRLSGYYQSDKGPSAFDQSFGGTEPDSFHTAGGSGRLRVDLTSNLQLDERAYYTWSRNAFDGYDTPTFTFGDDGEYGYTTQFVDYTGANLALLDGRLRNRLAFEYSAIDHHNYDPFQSGPPTTFEAHGRTNTVEYEGAFALAPGYQAVFGAQTERSNMITSDPFDPTVHAHTTINSGYGQVTGEVAPGLSLTGGVRYDDQTTVGGHVTGQASAAWTLNSGRTIMRASFGQGFKAPSLYQLYSQYGNTGLHPEEANGWDAGIEQHFLDGKLVLQATYFGRETENLIDFVSCIGVTTGVCASAISTGIYENVARAEAEGVELSADWKPIQALEISANYTVDDVEDRSPGSPTKGNQLDRRPKNSGNLDVGYVWPVKLRTDVALRYAGDSFNDNAHTILLKSYALVDLRLSYPLQHNLELYGRIENLTDQRYETIYQYGTMRRAGYVGVRYQF